MRRIDSNIKRSRLYEETLQKLGGQGETLFPTLREALSFAALIGFNERRRLPLDPRAGTEDIASGQYQLNQAVDIVLAIALAETKSTDIFKPTNEKDCIVIFEEYANGGLQLIQEWFEDHADSTSEDALWKGLKSIGFTSPETNQAEPQVVEPSF